jgi:hypothetical protein
MRRITMADWQLKIDISKEWDKSSEEETVENLIPLVDKLLAELKRIKPVVDKRFSDYTDDLDEIIEGFEDIKNDLNACDPNDYPDYDVFNNVLQDLYNWGDIPLDNKWPPKKLCWIGHI